MWLALTNWCVNVSSVLLWKLRIFFLQYSIPPSGKNIFTKLHHDGKKTRGTCWHLYESEIWPYRSSGGRCSAHLEIISAVEDAAARHKQNRCMMSSRHAAWWIFWNVMYLMSEFLGYFVTKWAPSGRKKWMVRSEIATVQNWGRKYTFKWSHDILTYASERKFSVVWMVSTMIGVLVNKCKTILPKYRIINVHCTNRLQKSWYPAPARRSLQKLLYFHYWFLLCFRSIKNS